MEINVSAQYNGGLLLDIILSTRCSYIGEPFRYHEEVLSLQPMFPPELSVQTLFHLRWMLRRFRCVQILLKLRAHYYCTQNGWEENTHTHTLLYPCCMACTYYQQCCDTYTLLFVVVPLLLYVYVPQKMHHTHKTLAAMACTYCQYYNNNGDDLLNMGRQQRVPRQRRWPSRDPWSAGLCLEVGTA